MYKKLEMWKSKVFSIEGREILIKVVAQATFTYAMSVFQIPSTLCDELQYPLSLVFCGMVDVKIGRFIEFVGKNYVNQVGWRNGFHKALLAKQGWRVPC